MSFIVRKEELIIFTKKLISLNFKKKAQLIGEMKVTELSVRELLATGIIEYKDTNPSVRSFKFISDRANVSESFLKRVAKGDDSVSLNPSKLLNIAKVVLPEEKRKFVVTYFYENVFHEHFEDLGIDPIRDKHLQEDNCRLGEDIENIIIQEDTLLVYNLACHENGVEEEEVQQMGELHLGGLRKLIDAGLVRKKSSESRYYAVNKNWSASFKHMRKKLRIYSSCYKAENFGKKRNYALSYSFGVNQEGIEVLQSKMRELTECLRDVREKYSGDRTIICSGFFDTISNYVYTKKNQSKNIFSLFIIGLLLNIGNTSASDFVNDQGIRCIKIYDSKNFGCVSNDKNYLTKFILDSDSKSIQNDDLVLDSKSKADLKLFQNAFNLTIDETSRVKKIYKFKDKIDKLKGVKLPPGGGLGKFTGGDSDGGG